MRKRSEPVTDEAGVYLDMDKFLPRAGLLSKHAKRTQMANKSYDNKVLEAFKAVCDRDAEGAASPSDVVKEMQARDTLSPLDTVIDIADIMKRLLG